MNYFVNKDERKYLAKLHTEEMSKTFSDQIANCINNSSIYTENTIFTAQGNMTPTIFIKQTDSVSAIMDCLIDETITVLNFASFKNPGGMFINGSSAQEENLCHASFLYNVLKTFNKYYEYNKQHKNKGLYINRAIYSPNIIFNNNYLANVITCAAPNKSLLYKYGNFTEQENSQALESRIKFIINIVNEHPCDNLILGAYGTGVFKQNIEDVAQLFKKYTNKINAKNIIYAIPDTKTFNKFSSILVK